MREWIDGVIAQIQEGGPGGAIDIGLLLPLVTGATSILGAIFGYVILPVWVFYLLKDRVGLTTQFDAMLPAAWRFDVWATLRLVQRGSEAHVIPPGTPELQSRLGAEDLAEARRQACIGLHGEVAIVEYLLDRARAGEVGAGDWRARTERL